MQIPSTGVFSNEYIVIDRSAAVIIVDTEVTDDRTGVELVARVFNSDRPYLLPISAMHPMPLSQRCSLFTFY